MSVGPRIVFTRFVHGESPKLQPWISHLRRSLRVDATAPIPIMGNLDSGAVVWHLVSGNNRQLGRSARIYPTFEQATADARLVVDGEPLMQVTLVSEHLRGVYGWYASIDGEPVVTSSRWYETERDRARAIGLALPSMAKAVLLPGSRLVDVSLMRGGV